MITSVILAGICIKLAIVFLVVVGRMPNAKVILRKVREAISPSKKVYLTTNTIREYQMRFEKDETDTKTTESNTEQPDYSSQIQSSIKLLKKIFGSLKSKNDKKKTSQKNTSVIWAKNDPILPTRSGVYLDKSESEIGVFLDSSTSSNCTRDSPIVPCSQSNQDNLINFKQFIKVSEALVIKKQRSLASYKASNKRIPSTSNRSRLAVSLAKILVSLEAHLEIGASTPKSSIIKSKLDRLAVQASKRLAHRGATVLAPIPEETFN